MESLDLSGMIFDLDGVLADSEGLHVWAWQRLFSELGLPFDLRWVREWVGVPDVEIAGRVAERFATVADGVPLVEEKRLRFRELVSRHLRPFAGVAGELEECRAMPMAIGTSSARAEALLMLRVMDFETFFPVVVAGDDVARVKPAPDIFLEASSRLRLPPQQCIVLEDSPGGIQAAREAGMSVVAVATSFAPERLQGAQRVFATTADSIRWLRSVVRTGSASA